jgi:hypothetical protein
MPRGLDKTLLSINPVFVLAAMAVLSAEETSATVSGEVRDWHDALVPNLDAELRLQTPPHTIFSVRTGDDGKFKFTVLPAGTYTLTLTYRGFRTLRLKSIRVGSGEHKVLPPLRLDVSPSDGGGPPLLDHLEPAPSERAGNLSGRVENKSERLVSHAKVQLFCDEKSCGETNTAANGEFIFFNLSPGDDYEIRVTCPGYYPWQRDDYEIQAGYDATYGPIVLRRRVKLSRAASTVR